MCCEGKEVDWKYLIPPEKQDIVKMLGSFLGQQMGGPNTPMTGASPFPGMLSAPPDQSMLAAMNTMMGQGGYGGYAPRPFPTAPMTGPGMPMGSGFSGFNPPGGGGPGGDSGGGRRPPWKPEYDPDRPTPPPLPPRP